MFYTTQVDIQKGKYIEYLKMTSSLSKLFSDSLSPYLYYRAAENIFSLAFEAENLSRSDVAIDAVKGEIGFGLKTFLHNNGKTFQKIAEFNAIRNEYSDMTDTEVIKFISEARNKRLDLVIESYQLKKLIYHCLTRHENTISVYEFPMDMIIIDTIKDVNKKGNTIKFTDGINKYSFNLSKSTLYKRFVCKKSLEDIHIDILAEPYTALNCISKSMPVIAITASKYPFIYLPLYAPSSNSFEPGLKSGINQWNSAPREVGKLRNDNELYIPVPSWIHKIFIGFFPDNVIDKFDLILPDGNILNSKMCQGGQKGLMSNPNKALGKWVLRDVLKVPPRTLIDRAYLDRIGIDSVIIYKLSDTEYKIDFASLGKYEEFREANN
ncbi:MAG TPA: NgoFVII family restriction endonuclease [Archaeoglobus profundus]|nr:NgoFVII family restriction endonuclease [Archaeoglobus profundus]